MVCNVFAYVKKTSSRSGDPLERGKEHGEKAIKKGKKICTHVSWDLFTKNVISFWEFSDAT